VCRQIGDSGRITGKHKVMPDDGSQTDVSQNSAWKKFDYIFAFQRRRARDFLALSLPPIIVASVPPYNAHRIALEATSETPRG
jgi:hypothetical protein